MIIIWGPYSFYGMIPRVRQGTQEFIDCKIIRVIVLYVLYMCVVYVYDSIWCNDIDLVWYFDIDKVSYDSVVTVLWWDAVIRYDINQYNKYRLYYFNY